jgi:hypothetical protein
VYFPSGTPRALIFCLLNAQGRLQSLFALPVGGDDVAVGVLAPALALRAWWQRKTKSAGWKQN